MYRSCKDIPQASRNGQVSSTRLKAPLLIGKNELVCAVKSRNGHILVAVPAQRCLVVSPNLTTVMASHSNAHTHEAVERNELSQLYPFKNVRELVDKPFNTSASAPLTRRFQHAEHSCLNYLGGSFTTNRQRRNPELLSSYCSRPVFL